MSEFRCAICGAEATIHITMIDHGVKSDKHLCAAHASASGVPPLAGHVAGQMMVDGVAVSSAQQALAQSILSNLRGSVNFIKSHGRMPVSVDELRAGMAMKGDVAAAEIKDAELAKALVWMERTIKFVEAHGSMPQTENELTDFDDGP